MNDIFQVDYLPEKKENKDQSSWRSLEYSGVEIKTTIRFKNEIIEDIRIEDYIC